MPSATPRELAGAMRECVDGGARIINLSLASAERSTAGGRQLEDVLDQTVRHGVIVVAAAGNQGTLGSSTITRHPWVIPVVGCDRRGQPIPRVESGCVNREAGPDRTGPRDHQPGAGRTTAHVRWHERGRTVRDWRDRTAVVGVSLGDPQLRSGSPSPDASVCPASLGGSTIARCRGGVLHALGASVRRWTRDTRTGHRQLFGSKRGSGAPSPTAWIHH